MVRVVAGTARGRRLVVPDGPGVRPSSDRVREAMFNALHSQGAVTGARVLDLFSGCGALGIEALSRGAAHATFVERDRRAFEAMQHNLDRLGLAERAEPVPGDAVELLAGKDAAAARFDLILCDPPYAFDGWHSLLDLCGTVLASDGIVVVESDRLVALPKEYKTIRSRRYGATVVAFATAADVGSR